MKFNLSDWKTTPLSEDSIINCLRIYWLTQVQHGSIGLVWLGLNMCAQMGRACKKPLQGHPKY